MTDHGSSYSFKNGFGPTEHSDGGRNHPQSSASMPPMNDVELDTREKLNEIASYAGPDGLQKYQLSDDQLDLIVELFTQEKANLQAAMEAEVPEKAGVGGVYDYGKLDGLTTPEIYNLALDQVHKAIAAVFNKGGSDGKV